MAEAIYRLDGDGYVPSEAAGTSRGAGSQHGGAVAALLARAVERQIADPGLSVVRLTVELMQPVPMRRLAIAVRTVRAGRRIQVIEASLLDDGTPVSRAGVLLLRRTDGAPAVEASPAPLDRRIEEFKPYRLGSGPARHPPPLAGFYATIDVRRDDRDGTESPPAAWLRNTRLLVEGEPLTPLQRVAAIADFIHGVAGTGQPETRDFINADSTVYLHRMPAGEWIGIRAERTIEPSDLGVARAVLLDSAGPFGSASEAILPVQRRLP